MACLDERRRDFAAISDVLASADGEVVVNALGAAENLRSPSSCNEASVLLSRAERPATPEAAAKVAALREPVARVSALYIAGKYLDAEALADRIAADASAAGDQGLEAELFFWRGRLEQQLGNADVARQLERAAVADADAAGADGLRVRALSQLIVLYADDWQLAAMREYEAAATAAPGSPRRRYPRGGRDPLPRGLRLCAPRR